MISEQLVTGAAQTVGEIRLILALGVLAVLLYWTVERVLGQGDDPTLRYSKSTETGSSSFLVSGTDAVLLVTGIAVLALAPEIAAGNTALLAVLFAIVLAHWYVEKEEREG